MSMPYSLTCAYVEWTDQMKPGHETVWRQVFAFGRLLRDLGCRVRDLRAPMRDQDPRGRLKKLVERKIVQKQLVTGILAR